MDDLMDSLVDKSLMLAAPGSDGTRDRLLEPLRQWAHEQLVRNGEADVVRLVHAHHFARLVADLSPAYQAQGLEVALRRTLNDYPNVRLAIVTLANTGDANRHLRASGRLPVRARPPRRGGPARRIGVLEHRDRPGRT